MSRYVVLFRNLASRSYARDRVLETPGVTVLDEMAGRAMLVEASTEAMQRIREVIDDGVLISDETIHPRPSPARQRTL